MVMREAHFRIKVARGIIVPSAEKPPVKKETAVVKEGKPVVSLGDKREKSTKTCVGDLGESLGAVNKDGRPYACKFGDACTFVHMSIANKSKQRLLDIVGSLTATARADLTRAVLKRP